MGKLGNCKACIHSDEDSKCPSCAACGEACGGLGLSVPLSLCIGILTTSVLVLRGGAPPEGIVPEGSAHMSEFTSLPGDIYCEGRL